MKIVMKEIFVQYPEELHEFHNDLPLLPEKMKIKEVWKLVTNFIIKKNTSFK